MLDGLLGRNFSSKCKSLVKSTRTRIEVLRKRAEAKQRFLKEDLAKLLANGLDINAYGRTEEFLAGLGLLCCYDFIDQVCEHIVKNMSSIQKQRECPEECRQAIASVMFAAARFSDLPELRDLRDLFQERYGSSLEYYVNQKLVEKLDTKSPAVEMKIQLLQDIASEFSINWDSRGFEQRMVKPPAFAQDQPKKYESVPIIDEKSEANRKNTLPRVCQGNVSSKEKFQRVDDGHRPCNGGEHNFFKKDLDLQSYGQQKISNNGQMPIACSKSPDNGISPQGRVEWYAGKHGSHTKDDIIPEKVRSSSLSRRKKPDCTVGEFLCGDGLNAASIGDSSDTCYREKSEGDSIENGCKGASSASNDRSSQPNVTNLSRQMPDQEAERLKSHCNSIPPPPYVKSKDNIVPPPYAKDGKIQATRAGKREGLRCDEHYVDPSSPNRANSLNSLVRISKGAGNSNAGGLCSGPTKINRHDYHNRKDVPLPKPRSMRRKHSKSLSRHDAIEDHEDVGVVKRTSSSRRREHSRKGLQLLFDDEHHQKDEEERMIDKLLLHYSKKPSTYDVGKLRKKSDVHSPHQQGSEFGHSLYNGVGGRDDEKSEFAPPPTRSVSLPHQQHAPSKGTKVFTRANSFQPENEARHVHPKLPDYDDLAAQFAALRGR